MEVATLKFAEPKKAVWVLYISSYAGHASQWSRFPCSGHQQRSTKTLVAGSKQQPALSSQDVGASAQLGGIQGDFWGTAYEEILVKLLYTNLDLPPFLQICICVF